MKIKFNIVLNTVIALCLTLGLVFLGSWQSLQAQAKSPAAPIYLRADVFRPAAGDLPDIPPDLTIQGYPAGERGIYLVQFNGPVQQEWKAECWVCHTRHCPYFPQRQRHVTTGVCQLRSHDHSNPDYAGCG